MAYIGNTFYRRYKFNRSIKWERVDLEKEFDNEERECTVYVYLALMENDRSEILDLDYVKCWGLVFAFKNRWIMYELKKYQLPNKREELQPKWTAFDKGRSDFEGKIRLGNIETSPKELCRKAGAHKMNGTIYDLNSNNNKMWAEDFLNGLDTRLWQKINKRSIEDV